MMTLLAIAAVVGLGIGLWGEISEQRRRGRMARDYKQGKVRP